MLFQAEREPQHPRVCKMPAASASAARRLGESIALEGAKVACAKVDESMREACVHDVMVMGDFGVAESF